MSDPVYDLVVIGGGVAAAGDLLLAPIRAEIARRVHTTDAREVQIVVAELGTLAGAIGAAVHGAERSGHGGAQAPRNAPGGRP